MTIFIATPRASREAGRRLSIALRDHPDGFGCVRLTCLREGLSSLAEADAVVLIHAEPVSDLLRFIDRAREQRDRLPVLVWGAPERADVVVEYLVSGARACFLEGEEPEMLSEAFPVVREGSHYLPPPVQRILLERFVAISNLVNISFPVQQQDPDGLTEREQQVLALIAEGHTNLEIAEQLFLEVGTVKNHVHHILAKLDVPDRQAAARYFQTRRRFTSS